MAPSVERLELRDGRTLAWTDAGAPDGIPVLAFHGTPGSRLQMLAAAGSLAAASVRWIVPDRPGYGLSTYHRGRTFRDWADDVAELADHLGLDRFAVVGMSGGGPHAVVCGRFLADRVAGLTLLSSIASCEAPGTEAGMMGPNRLFVRIARRAPALNALPFGLVSAIGRRWPERALASARKTMPPPDAAIVARPEVAAVFAADLGQASKTTGRAAAQDFRLIARDWGFRLEDVTVPTHIWHATADVNVPVQHARTFADRIPGAVLHVVEGEGHLMALDLLDDIAAPLTDAFD
jgi:pimeloyl-ACP methyl ester carboxylesterase